LNLNRSEKRHSFRDYTGSGWVRPHSDEWRAISSKTTNLVLVSKNTEPSVMSGIRKNHESVSKLDFVRNIIAYPSDALAKLIAWILADI
jgi:hypothetical protein